MTVHSGGILLFRRLAGRLQLMLVHPGGPYWEHKDAGVWSIPKGLFEENEKPLDAARREFAEETGFEAEGEFIELGELVQPSKKVVHAWALERDLDTTRIKSNTFSLEWPPDSGHVEDYPEIDKGQWFDIDEARKKISRGQAGFIDRLIDRLQYVPPAAGSGASADPDQGHLP
jgi:predicted NUDIX family NTP pyrophosphohydrolase